MNAPFFLLVQPDKDGWFPYDSFDEVVDAIIGLDCVAVYEAEPRNHMAPLLSDASEKAAKAWLEKYQGEVEFESDWDENDAPELVKKWASEELRRLFDDGEIEATTTRADQAMHMADKL